VAAVGIEAAQDRTAAKSQPQFRNVDSTSTFRFKCKTKKPAVSSGLFLFVNLREFFLSKENFKIFVGHLAGGRLGPLHV
jgi:hypothetical protein